jgi:hypothetical protein
MPGSGYGGGHFFRKERSRDVSELYQIAIQSKSSFNNTGMTAVNGSVDI